MSKPDTTKRIHQTATTQTIKEGRTPYPVDEQDLQAADRDPRAIMDHIPFLGSHCPPGWDPVDLPRDLRCVYPDLMAATRRSWWTPAEWGRLEKRP